MEERCDQFYSTGTVNETCMMNIARSAIRSGHMFKRYKAIHTIVCESRELGACELRYQSLYELNDLLRLCAYLVISIKNNHGFVKKEGYDTIEQNSLM